MTPAGLLDTTPRRAAQRRTVRTLAASQVLSGLGNGSALAVGSVVAGYGGLAVLSAMLALVVAAAALRGGGGGG
ncbi:MFS transporter, partial [Micrococcus sp. M4NT]|nr:MFS transporter [Micrococcus sp. M4NT]